MKVYEKIIELIKYNRYVQAPNEALSHHWQKNHGKRVLMVCDIDNSGSFYRWATALNRHTDYAARMISFRLNKYTYEMDILIRRKDDLKDALALAAEADIIHFKMEHYYRFKKSKKPQFQFFKTILEDPDFKMKKLVFTHYGSGARSHQNNIEYREFVKQFDARVAMTPDLNFDWFDGHYICHAIDANVYPYCWQDNNIMSHSPSNQILKATPQLLKAVHSLDSFTKNWKFDLITGVSNQECIKRKRSSSLFFDQAGQDEPNTMGVEYIIGNYANAALEAMVCGIPTIAHVSEQTFQGAQRSGKLDWCKECPILNTPALDCEGFARTIQDFIDLTPEARKEISLKTRAFVEKFHDYPAVAQELAQVYEGL